MSQHHDKINIKRSDGRAHDLSALATRAQLQATVESATLPAPPINNNNITNNITNNATSGGGSSGGSGGSEEHHDCNAPVYIGRSDGLNLDLVNILKAPGSVTPADDEAKTVDVPKPTFTEKLMSRLSFVERKESQKTDSSKVTTPAAGVTYHPTSIRIVHMSDTRNFLLPSGKFNQRFLPEGDILVHSGNFTDDGLDEEFSLFNSWLQSVSSFYPYRVVVPGSRDVQHFHGDWNAVKSRLSNATHVLCHEEATVLGMRIYGCPWYYQQKYNYSLRAGASSDTDGNKFGEIPDGVHILVTHGPAFGKLDAVYTVEGGKRQHLGSTELLNAIARVRPALHLHGHCSDSRGFIPALGHTPLIVNSTMSDAEARVLYACPFVILAKEIFAALPSCLGAVPVSSKESTKVTTSSVSSRPKPTTSDAFWTFEVTSLV